MKVPDYDNLEQHVIANILTTPDGTEIVSKYRHDFVQHWDKNGQLYYVDGGQDYFRYSGDGKEKLRTINTSSPFNEIRKYFFWGTRGKTGRDSLMFKPLKDLTEDHILSILDTQHQLTEWRKEIFRRELIFRKSKFVKDVKEV